MKNFFNVTDLNTIFDYISIFSSVSAETIMLTDGIDRILSQDITAETNIPNFSRSTMDGFAVKASSTFGSSESNPAYLTIKGTVHMGESSDLLIGPGEAAKISTGGMLPSGSDGVVMVEHTDFIDESTIEVYKSIAPGQHVIEKGEDIKKGDTVLYASKRLRPQEIGVLAALGIKKIQVYKQPVISIISTGDEIIPVEEQPSAGQIRDINSYTLSGLIQKTSGIPVRYGIVKDNFDELQKVCLKALQNSDMVLISGGSSVGSRDFTIDVINALPDSRILAHGIAISPGKPTILATAQNKPVWGLPGHVVSAMVVFDVVVKPFIHHLCGLCLNTVKKIDVQASLTRNISSAQGRVDFVRVRLIQKDEMLFAEPILGKSGLINTMVKADGLITVDMNTEGLDKGTEVQVTLLA